MFRLTMALVALLCVLAPASARLAPSQDRLRSDRSLPPHLVRDAGPSADAQDDGGLVINDDTEIRLDGQTCKYNDVPRDAEIILLDVSSDMKAVRKIHFRTKK